MPTDAPDYIARDLDAAGVALQALVRQLRRGGAKEYEVATALNALACVRRIAWARHLTLTDIDGAAARRKRGQT